MVKGIHSSRNDVVFFPERLHPVFTAQFHKPRIVGTRHLENLLMPRLFIIHVESVVRNGIDALEKLPDANRKGKRNRLDFQHRFNLIQQVQNGTTIQIHLIDKRNDGRMAHPADFHQLDRLLFHAVHAVNQNQRGIDGGKRPIGVFAKVLVPRRIDQIEPAIFKRKIQNRTRNGNSAVLFDFHPVADRIAAIRLGADMARFSNHFPEPQEFFGNGRLAGIRMADNGKSTSFGNFGMNRQNRPRIFYEAKYRKLHSVNWDAFPNPESWTGGFLQCSPENPRNPDYSSLPDAPRPSPE